MSEMEGGSEFSCGESPQRVYIIFFEGKLIRT